MLDERLFCLASNRLALLRSSLPPLLSHPLSPFVSQPFESHSCRSTRKLNRQTPVARALPARGVTLIELLIVVSIIGVLAALTLPAVQATRESMRQAQCSNHLRQLQLASLNYQTVHRFFPPSFCVTREQILSGRGHSWSVHARLLPFLEGQAATERIDLSIDWHAQVDRGVADLRPPMWLCPSEPRTEIRYRNGERYVAPTSYGFSAGTWHVFTPPPHTHTMPWSTASGDGSYVVNGSLRPAAFLDGLSNTLAIAEVKTYQPYLRNLDTTDLTEIPALADIASLRGQFKTTGHTVWPDGRVHHSGITTAFPPGTQVHYELDGQVYDIDFSTQQEGKSAFHRTYAAITARSHHADMVQVARMDGSVHAITYSIDGQLYQAMGTRAGSERVQTQSSLVSSRSQ